MKIKGYGRLAVYYSKLRARQHKKSFQKNVEDLFDKYSNKTYEKFDSDVLTFTGGAYFYEHLYVMFNFINRLGNPKQWLIVDDGSLTEDQKKFYRRFPFIVIRRWDDADSEKFSYLKQFGDRFPFCKGFHGYLNFLDTMEERCFFVESDVLIGGIFKEFLPLFEKGNWYLVDTGPHLGNDYLQKYGRPMFPMNGGLMVFNHRPHVDILYNYMVEKLMDGTFEYFTVQGAYQLMIEADEDFRPMDPRIFLTNCSDHFKIKLDHDLEQLALRHFVGPVRHKMWQTNWKKVLKFK